MFPCFAIFCALDRSETSGRTRENGMSFSPLRSPYWKAQSPRTASEVSSASAKFLFGCAFCRRAGMALGARAFLAAAARVTDAPDGVRSVISDQQRTVRRHCNANGPSPNVSVVHHKTGYKIFVIAAGTAGMVRGDRYPFISGAPRSVPGTGLRGETGVLVVSGELM